MKERSMTMSSTEEIKRNSFSFFSGGKSKQSQSMIIPSEMENQ
jgi:hypothetical protein